MTGEGSTPSSFRLRDGLVSGIELEVGEDPARAACSLTVESVGDRVPPLEIYADRSGRSEGRSGLTLAHAEHADLLAYQTVGADLVGCMIGMGIDSLKLPPNAEFGGPDQLEMLLVGALIFSCRPFLQRHSKPKEIMVLRLEIVAADTAIARRAISIAETVNIARAWVACPPNRLTPASWVDDIAELFRDQPVTVRTLDPEGLSGIGAEALLAVGRGSVDGSRLLIVEYRGDPDRCEWDAALVGKGITFDAGGLNLKPRPNIAKMKLDMAGGAAVLGALRLAVQRGASSNVLAVVPIAENVIDARAFRPGDVVRTCTGDYVEVADTDFEGRLVLADAIGYAIQAYQPGCIVDLATLTTAVTACLHEEFAALYATSDALAAQLAAAGDMVGERSWRMPLDSRQSYLSGSDIADLCNIGVAGYFGMGVGSPTAGAHFLRHFVGDIPWAHLDITGVAWTSRRAFATPAGATGYGARLLDRWLSLREDREAESGG